MNHKEKWNNLLKENDYQEKYIFSDSKEGRTEPIGYRESGKRDYSILIEQDKLLKDYLDNFKDKIVMEIGCGDGRMTDIPRHDHNAAIEMNGRVGNAEAGIHKAAVYFQAEFRRALKAFENHRHAVPVIKGLQVAHAQWMNKAMPDVTLGSCLGHLVKEVAEIVESPDDITEYADVYLLLLSAMTKANIDIQDVVAEAWAKLEVNKKRTWIKQPEGHYEHDRSGE